MRHILVFILLLAFGHCYAEDNSANVRAARLPLVKALGAEKMIVYKPKTTKAVVTIFTDMDCSYCRKLHDEVPKLMDLGIEVRYVLYPRRGMGSPSYTKMVSIWCSPDKGKAMGEGLEGHAIKPATCHNPIVEHMMLGRKLGIAGTPTILFEDGTLGGGYMSAARLARQAIQHSGKD